MTFVDFVEKGKKSFLDLLLESSETDNKITEEDIRNEVDTFMFEVCLTTSLKRLLCRINEF